MRSDALKILSDIPKLPRTPSIIPELLRLFYHTNCNAYNLFFLKNSGSLIRFNLMTGVVWHNPTNKYSWKSIKPERDIFLTTFDSCTKCVGCPGIIHDRTPDCHPVSWAWMTSQVNVAWICMLRGSLMCLGYIF